MLRAVLLAAALAAVLVPSAHAARTVPSGFFGVMADGVLLERSDAAFSAEFGRMRSAGVETIRPVIYWADLQPTRDGPLELAATDRVFAQAARSRLKILPVVLRTPEWARISPSNFASPPRDPRDFARFMTLLVGRYGPKGTLWTERPELPRNVQRRWEVWNEPNLDRYWSSPQPFAKRFVALHDAASKAIRAADPGAKVVLAAMGNDSWRALRLAYRAGLRGSSYDEAALHPFSGRLSNVLKIVRLNRDVLADFGDRRKPVVISEITWPSAKGKTKSTTGFETTESGQAMRLRNAFRAFVARRRADRITGVIWSTWLTPDRGSPSSFDWSGLRKLDPRNAAGTPVDKPALREFRAIARRAAGRTGD